MAQIEKRTRKDGSLSYVAKIAIRKNGQWAHREARSFDKLSAAKNWHAKRMKQITAAGADMGAIKSKGKTLSAAIDLYITETNREIGRTKAQVLRSIREYDIADKDCADIESHDIVQFARELGATRTPATVGNYMSHLGAIFAVARPAWGIPLDQQAMKDAFVVCNRLGITGKAKKRDRRPTLNELDALLTMFEDKHRRRPKSVPMHRIVGFAKFSTRRQEEITRISWTGLDQTHSRVFIKDMKHPGDNINIGNDVWCDLPAPALKIALSMPKKSQLVFPYDSRSISAAFTRA